MYAITGITGKVGGQVARFLMQEGQAVRAVARDVRKGVIWQNHRVRLGGSRHERC